MCGYIELIQNFFYMFNNNYMYMYYFRNTLVTNVRHHILSLNWGHRVQLKEKSV